MVYEFNGPWGWSHKGFGARRRYMNSLGYRTGGAGENVKMGGYPEAAIKAWMNSRGHRRNILRGGYNVEAISLAMGSYSRPMYCQMMMHIKDYDPKENYDKPAIPKRIK